MALILNLKPQQLIILMIKKIVKATEGVKIFLEKNTTIKADKFIYEKEKSTVLIKEPLTVSGLLFTIDE